MVTADDIITFLNNYSNPTTQFLFDIDMDGLERFIKPETNLYSLVMLSKAREQGLDLVFVDTDKFFDNAMLRIRGDMLNGQGPFEGAWYIEFQLSSVLIGGQTFEFIDHSESMGFGFMLDTMNFGNEIVDHFLSNTGKVNNGCWYEEDEQTIQQLAVYINQVLNPSEVKRSLLSRMPTKREFNNFLFATVVLLGMCIYYSLRAIYRGYKWFKESLSIKKASKSINT
jgi:hypothetical protein